MWASPTTCWAHSNQEGEGAAAPSPGAFKGLGDTLPVGGEANLEMIWSPQTGSHLTASTIHILLFKTSKNNVVLNCGLHRAFCQVSFHASLPRVGITVTPVHSWGNWGWESRGASLREQSPLWETNDLKPLHMPALVLLQPFSQMGVAGPSQMWQWRQWAEKAVQAPQFLPWYIPMFMCTSWVSLGLLFPHRVLTSLRWLLQSHLPLAFLTCSLTPLGLSLLLSRTPSHLDQSDLHHRLLNSTTCLSLTAFFALRILYVLVSVCPARL